MHARLKPKAMVVADARKGGVGGARTPEEIFDLLYEPPRPVPL
jgi:hypothetical protein